MSRPLALALAELAARRPWLRLAILLHRAGARPATFPQMDPARGIGAPGNPPDHDGNRRRSECKS